MLCVVEAKCFWQGLVIDANEVCPFVSKIITYKKLAVCYVIDNYSKRGVHIESSLPPRKGPFLVGNSIKAGAGPNVREEGPAISQIVVSVKCPADIDNCRIVEKN